MKVDYNILKLSEYRSKFYPCRALVIGVGAVGTYLMEYMAKMGISTIDGLDFDHFTLENAAKHSCLIRTPEDAGRNKAVCASERLQPLLDEGCSSNGINAELCLIGPEALSDYHVIFLAVDNRDAEILLNELVHQLPEDRRPIIIRDGTHGEMAQSVILNNKEFCLRCMIDDSWMKDSSIKTSCTGPQLRQIDGIAEVVRTTNTASSMAAHLSCEQLRGYLLETPSVMNRRITYTAYPHLELSSSHPMPKKDCPGCAIKPPAHINWLKGTVLHTTLAEAIGQIEKALGTDDFEISVHRLNFKKVTYGGFIVNDVCHSCGKSIKVLKHEGRTFLKDMLCDSCREQGKSPFYNVEFLHGTILHAFNNECDEELKNMTLYELGYPLGAHIEVIQRNGAFDFLEDEKIVKTIFCFDEDHEQMHHICKL